MRCRILRSHVAQMSLATFGRLSSEFGIWSSSLASASIARPGPPQARSYSLKSATSVRPPRHRIANGARASLHAQMDSAANQPAQDVPTFVPRLAELPCRSRSRCQTRCSVTFGRESCNGRGMGRTASFVTDCNRSFEESVRYSPYCRRQSVHRVRLRKPKRLPSCLQELAERMVNGRTFALGAIGRAGVSVQLALAGRAVASTGSATEEASQSGIGNRNADDLARY